MTMAGYTPPKYTDMQGSSFSWPASAVTYGYHAAIADARRDANDIMAQGELYVLLLKPGTRKMLTKMGVIEDHMTVCWMSCQQLRDEAPSEWGPVSNPGGARLVNGLMMLGVCRAEGKYRG